MAWISTILNMGGDDGNALKDIGLTAASLADPTGITDVRSPRRKQPHPAH